MILSKLIRIHVLKAGFLCIAAVFLVSPLNVEMSEPELRLLFVCFGVFFV